jgi:aspartate aminotransferase
MFAKRLDSFEESKTSGMRNRARQLIKDGKEIISFAAGELDIGPSNYVKESTERALRNKSSYLYTETLGIKELRELIAERVSRETNVPYTYEEVGVTAGAKQGLFNVALALFDSSSEVIIPTPAWGTFSAQLNIVGAKPIFYDTSLSNYQPNISEISGLITKQTRGIIINTPNNPTGVIYEKGFLSDLAELANKHNFFIIFDECYSKIVYHPFTHNNIVKIAPHIKDRTILINSFSKECAIAGWRIGYVAANKEIINAIKKLQGHTTSNPSSLGQYGILGSFEDGHELYLNDTINTLKEKRDILVSLLKDIKGIIYTVPQGAFYIYIDVKNFIGKTYKDWNIKDINSFTELLLQEGHVATVSGESFESSTGIRLSYTIPTEKIIQGVGKIKTILEEIKW